MSALLSDVRFDWDATVPPSLAQIRSDIATTFYRGALVCDRAPLPHPPSGVPEVEVEYECISCRYHFVDFVLRPCPACAGRVHRVER